MPRDPHQHPADLGRRHRRLFGGLCVAVIAGGLTIPSQVAPAVAAVSTTYVSPRGDDAAAGTSSAPKQTIGAALRSTPSNGKVVVESGSYHESLALQGHSGRSIVAAPGATVWLDGSRPVTGWAPDGNAYVAEGWNAQFDASPTYTKGAPDGASPSWQFVNPAHPMAAHPDQVWVDGVGQEQVGSRAQVRPGAFYVDYGSHRLYLGSDPAGHDVRASDLAKALTIQDPDTTISGINVRRYADSVPTLGAITVERPGARLSNLRVSHNATVGLGVFSTGAHVDDVWLSSNGMHGFLANRADGLRLNHVKVWGNNTEQFNYAPSAGGAKITRSQDVAVSGGYFDANQGTGLWLDESVYRFSIIGARFADNLRHGMSLEISGTGTVANNLVSGNVGDGMKVNDTDKVQIWNNTLTGNGRSIDIVQDARDQNAGGSYRDSSLPLTLRSERIVVRNNIMAAPRPDTTCLLCVEDYTHRFSAAQMRIWADGNLYQQPAVDRPRWLVVWSRGAGDPAVFTDLETLRRATGAERRGHLLRPTAALSRSYRPYRQVQRLTYHSVYRAPSWLARQVGVRTFAQRLGSWRH